MKKLFFLTSCRIHRPFNCDKKHRNGKYNLYDCLNTNWSENNFLGRLYESNYILQTLKYLINKDIENKDNIQVITPQKNMDKKHFLDICDTLMKADIIIIEIATIKYFMNNNIYLSNEHFNKLGIYPTKSGKLNKKELINNILEIEKLVNDIGKKVLFVTHFNFQNIPNRKLIIECVKNTAKYFFDPSCVINSYRKLSDRNHYTTKTEVEIMEKIHKCLSIM